MKINSQKKGFTLIELIVSISILIFAIVGINSVFYNMYLQTSNLFNKFTAVYLSQEGLEIVRNMRDLNFIKEQDWSNGLLICSAGCEADYKTGTDNQVTALRPFSSGGNFLRKDSLGLFAYDSPTGIDTIFKRKITITQEDADILRVNSLVTWTFNNTVFQFESVEYLYNWY